VGVYTANDTEGSLLKTATERMDKLNSNLTIQGKPEIEKTDHGMKVTYHGIDTKSTLWKDKPQDVTIELAPVTDYKASSLRTVPVTEETLANIPKAELNKSVVFRGVKTKFITAIQTLMDERKSNKESDPYAIPASEQAKPVVETATPNTSKKVDFKKLKF
jgi:hypothetical protein